MNEAFDVCLRGPFEELILLVYPGFLVAQVTLYPVYPIWGKRIHSMWLETTLPHPLPEWFTRIDLGCYGSAI